MPRPMRVQGLASVLERSGLTQTPLFSAQCGFRASRALLGADSRWRARVVDLPRRGYYACLMYGMRRQPRSRAWRLWIGSWVLALVLSSLVRSEADAAAPAKDAQSAKNIPTMRMFRQLLDELLTYAGSKTAFQSQKNHAEIARKLERFQHLAQHPTHPELQRKEYRLTLDILGGLLAETRRDFSNSREEYARNRLPWALDFCVSCHSRLPPKRRIETDPSLKMVRDPYERARMRLAFREFDNAAKDFKKLIEGYPKNGASAFDVARGLDYLAMIGVRVRRDPEAAKRELASLADLPALPQAEKKVVASWLEAIDAWAAEPAFDFEQADTAQIIARAERILGGKALEQPRVFGDRDNLIRYLRASTLLHRLLVERPHSEHAARAMYLLGVCYLSLNRHVFVGLDTAYLKACIRRAGSGKLAQRCYGLLEDSVVLGYSGSGGTHIPPEVAKELRNLAALAGAEPDLSNKQKRLK